MTDLAKQMVSEILGRKIDGVSDLSLADIEAILDYLTPAASLYRAP